MKSLFLIQMLSALSLPELIPFSMQSARVTCSPASPLMKIIDSINNIPSSFFIFGIFPCFRLLQSKFSLFMDKGLIFL